MDLVWMIGGLAGALIGFAFMHNVPGLGPLIGFAGVVAFIYGAVINHQMHTKGKRK